MTTVTINGNDYPVYADTDVADTYLAASVTVVGWSAAAADAKSAALVTATRLLDRQPWQGSKTDPAQPLAWPRTGILGMGGATVPQPIIDACCELAGMFVDGSTDVLDNSSTAQTTASLKAGSVGITYFRQDPMLATRFSTTVQELVGQFLAGSATAADVAGGYAGGTDQCSAFDRGYDLSRGL